MTNSEYLAKVGGSIIVNDTSAKAVDFIGFRALGATVVAALLDETPTDVKATYITTAASAIPDGAEVRISSGYFTSITLTSGAVELILK